MELKSARSFIEEHFGVDIDYCVLERVLQNDEFRALIADSFLTYHSVPERYNYLDHGYDNSDGYWKKGFVFSSRSCFNFKADATPHPVRFRNLLNEMKDELGIELVICSSGLRVVDSSLGLVN